MHAPPDRPARPCPPSAQPSRDDPTPPTQQLTPRGPAPAMDAGSQRAGRASATSSQAPRCGRAAEPMAGNRGRRPAQPGAARDREPAIAGGDCTAPGNGAEHDGTRRPGSEGSGRSRRPADHQARCTQTAACPCGQHALGAARPDGGDGFRHPCATLPGPAKADG
eukprot:gene1401-1960_t